MVTSKVKVDVKGPVSGDDAVYSTVCCTCLNACDSEGVSNMSTVWVMPSGC